MTKAYKYRGGIGTSNKDGISIFERDVSTIANDQIYLPTKCELNDPTEGFFDDDAITFILNQLKTYSSEVQIQYNRFLEKIESSGVYSLSKANNNELLWAYYASGHTGFAIEYDIDKLKQSLNHNIYVPFIFDFDVDYVKHIPVANILALRGGDPTPILKTYLGSKSLSWRHEKEYRLIVDGKGLFDIDYRVVTGIYFGYRMQEQEICFIMEKLKGRGLNYYKMNLLDRKYKLNPVEIEDKFPDTPQYLTTNLTYNIDDLLMPKELLGEVAYAYKNKLVEALEIVKHDPLINEIYTATIKMVSREPLFIIYAWTKSGFPPSKEYNFKLNDKGEIYQTK